MAPSQQGTAARDRTDRSPSDNIPDTLVGQQKAMAEHASRLASIAASLADRLIGEDPKADMTRPNQPQPVPTTMVNGAMGALENGNREIIAELQRLDSQLQRLTKHL